MSNQSLFGKTVAVTGCTGGLGRELCFSLAALGARLIMLDRNREKSLSFANELGERYKGFEYEHITLDLEDMDSARAALGRLCLIKPDIFIHNAGAYSIPRHTCSTGYDNIFEINFVTPYYMIRKLYEKDPKIKIVAVGSIAHTYSKIDENDIDFKTRKGSAKAYGNSKRFLMLALHRLFEGTESLAIVHPGISYTNITNHYPKVILALIKHPMKVIFMKPRKAVLSLTCGVFQSTPYGYWIGPRVFGVWGKPKMQKLPVCRTPDADKAERAAEKIYKELNLSNIERKI